MSSSKGKAKEIAINSKEAVVKLLDQDGNGQIDSVDIILLALKVPGVKIDRAKFLQKEFFKNHPQEVIDVALASTPAQAGISLEEINKIADEVIKFERNAVSGISLALGIPGGVAMASHNSSRYSSVLWIYVESCAEDVVFIWISRVGYLGGSNCIRFRNHECIDALLGYHVWCCKCK